MRIKRLGPGQYAILSNRKARVGKLEKRDIAEAEALAKLGLADAAKLFGLKVSEAASPLRGPAKLDSEQSRRELDYLMTHTKGPFKLPGLYGEAAKQEEAKRIEQKVVLQSIRTALIEEGLLLPIPRRKR